MLFTNLIRQKLLAAPVAISTVKEGNCSGHHDEPNCQQSCGHPRQLVLVPPSPQPEDQRPHPMVPDPTHMLYTNRASFPLVSSELRITYQDR